LYANKQKKKKLTVVNIHKYQLMKFQLPGFIIADLYKNSLVAVGDIQTKPQEKQEDKFIKIPVAEKENVAEPQAKNWFLGNNAKQITVLVNDAKNVFLDDASLQLLTGILAACQLNLADVAIVNTAHTNLVYQEIKQSLQCKYCLLFNVSTTQIQMPFTIPQYQVQQYDGCSFLLAPSLSEMSGTGKEAKVEKSKLWVCLKKMFDV